MRMSGIGNTGTQVVSNGSERPANCIPPAGVTYAIAIQAAAWPFNPGDVTPLEWWRTMPADHLIGSDLHQLRTIMTKVAVLKDHEWTSALQGDAAASIAIAISAMPIDQVTHKVDLAMSALALCALDGSAGAALVLSHILQRAVLDHPFGRELSSSWLALNLGRSLKGKTSVAPRRQGWLQRRVPA